MSAHERFNFKTIDEIRERTDQLGLEFGYDEDISVLGTPMKVGGLTAANRFAVLPMEGCDSNADGSPSQLVYDRYLKYAEGGFGLIWFEANAIVPEGRANELQMMLTASNVEKFRDLVRKVDDLCMQRHGFKPVKILQLTHSGRYSRPEGHRTRPIVPQHDPYLDKGNETIASDEYLDSLPERYVISAMLAKEAGFDGVDIKACHRYLMNELLASHTRPGRYGGSFENRSRLLLDSIRAVRKALGDDFIVASRFNVFDAHPYPYGFGSARDDMWTFDPSEPVRLVREMVEAGVGLLSNSGGNPYYIYPQVTRPFDKSSYGIPTPEEHPLESINRLFHLTEVVKKAAGDVPVIGNGYTWLRQFLPNAAAYNINAGRCDFVGLGRESFAYPDAPKDTLENGHMDPGKCCVTCSLCTQIMRDHGTTGCVVRNSAVYMPLYRKFNAEAVEREHRV
ncbi:MAG: NADH:flavin oxidoreductase [Spirochaetales bacterium]|nr:NADH:flavin oxidoreductase [Spirochaetales bacterium]